MQRILNLSVYIYVLIASLYATQVSADYTCLSERDGLRRMALHAVPHCPCPCRRYLRVSKRNTCINCDHFHGSTTESWERQL